MYRDRPASRKSRSESLLNPGNPTCTQVLSPGDLCLSPPWGVLSVSHLGPRYHSRPCPSLFCSFRTRSPKVEKSKGRGDRDLGAKGRRGVSSGMGPTPRPSPTGSHPLCLREGGSRVPPETGCVCRTPSTRRAFPSTPGDSWTRSPVSGPVDPGFVRWPCRGDPSLGLGLRLCGSSPSLYL